MSKICAAQLHYDYAQRSFVHSNFTRSHLRKATMGKAARKLSKSKSSQQEVMVQLQVIGENACNKVQHPSSSFKWSRVAKKTKKLYPSQNAHLRKATVGKAERRTQNDNSRKPSKELHAKFTQ